MKLFDIADVIRSKNSGPYELTFDIIFKEYDMFRKVLEANVLNEDVICTLYGIKKEDIIGIMGFDPAKAIKITIVRPIPSGALGESDVYGAQQHSPLLNFEFEF
ncbi:DUF4387 domain-containing protein [Anaeropeptidivorans aminofermentans]|jgi:hypothetical protein|uniref:DUF4387 domain-containing protein n=1 Tax=Anaeropeptidivorans aminofermentans TaxID=2934315 RepID=UPI0020243B75|nr:DUF4387 domain-containing protein [Anaeropeptidivorans aminofermentans]MBE6012945.1 DUF4387 domain-containing protein [Lachnospiraceae bacterium]